MESQGENSVRWDGTRDRELAIADLADRLPSQLAPLARLAYNYHWTWDTRAAALFERLDPERWNDKGRSARSFVQTIAPRRLWELANDPSYVEAVKRADESLRQDLNASPHPKIPADRPLAYLCSEYGIHGSLAIYGGGLGVLAGDMLKSASDLRLPFVAVGLFYRQGYFHQRIDGTGWQQEYWVNYDFNTLPVVLVTGPDGKPLTIDITLRARTVRIQIWRVEVGRVPLYLLDTDREDNHPIDRWITGRLYVGDRHTRLAQYAVLGVGGVRALAALGIDPSLVHLNEGHPSLSSFERIRAQLAAGKSFEEAVSIVREHTIFTTHTPVPAGNEGYNNDEVDAVLGSLLDSLGIDREKLSALGRVRPTDAHESISMIPLSLRTSRASNGVSERHGKVARTMWREVWPERHEQDVPITSVTNGVHTLTWMATPMQELLARHLGDNWIASLSDAKFTARVQAIPDRELWDVRCQLRAKFIEVLRMRSMRERLARGDSPEYVDAAARTLDPKALTIGFARRVATYKRLYLLARLPEQLNRLIGTGSTPIQMVIAGKAHPQDHEAKQVLFDMMQFTRNNEVGRHVVFIEDYDMTIAPHIVAGVDLWLNVPRPPLEASGTSGMKVVLNGGLNLSVLDGWWEEACDGENGWGIRTPEVDHHAQDDHDAKALFGLLENEVVPLFYHRGADGVPLGWTRKVKASLTSLAWRFSSERMLRDYVDRMYAPR